MRQPLALKALATALDDDDVEVRYTAVMGLAETTGQKGWGPSMPAFVEDEQRYLQYWRDWIKNR
jgi:hypothetical protein